MKRILPSYCRRVTLLALLVLALSVTTTFAVVPRARATAQDCGSWHVYPAPPPPMYGAYYGVALSSHTNVWAVGEGYVPTQNYSPINSGVIEHWDGLGWHTVASPQPANYRNDLYAVAALSANDAWAVGSYQNANTYVQQQRTLIEHWNGRVWSVVPSPNRPVFYNILFGVAAISATDVWVVGSSSALLGQTTSKTLIEHWNGINWTIVDSPNTQNADGFAAVTALSPNDVWAVGSQFLAFTTGPVLIEHWNGHKWNIVPSPPTGGPSELRAVAGATSNSIWAVGDYPSHGGIAMLTEYWNGTTWSIVPNVKLPPGDSSLMGVVALRTNDVWAVGRSTYRTSILHWDGKQWSAYENPGNLNFLASIAGRNQNDLWAVGSVIMHYCHEG